jgi:long-subunit acyl-CoA synthetase (AMP-forming)
MLLDNVRYAIVQFGELRTELGSGLLHYGLAPHQTVGIYSVNCTGWVLTAEACNAYSMVTVPLYDTLGPDAVRYISGHAELAAIACSANLLSVLLPCLAECPTIQLVVRRSAGMRTKYVPFGVRDDISSHKHLQCCGSSMVSTHTRRSCHRLYTMAAPAMPACQRRGGQRHEL